MYEINFVVVYLSMLDMSLNDWRMMNWKGRRLPRPDFKLRSRDFPEGTDEKHEHLRRCKAITRSKFETEIS